VPIIIDKKVEETPKPEPVYTSGNLSPAIKAGNIVIGKIEEPIKPKPAVKINKGKISPAIQAGNIVIESVVEETIPVKGKILDYLIANKLKSLMEVIEEF
jgi:hypothetical protein